MATNVTGRLYLRTKTTTGAVAESDLAPREMVFSYTDAASEYANLIVKGTGTSIFRFAPINDATTTAENYTWSAKQIQTALNNVKASLDELNEITDVNIVSPADGQALVYSGTTWVNGYPDRIAEGDSRVEVVDTGTGSIDFFVDNVRVADMSAASGLRVDKVTSVSGSGIAFSDSVDIPSVTINSAYTFATADGLNGQVLVTNGAGQLSWADNGADSVTMEINQTAHGFSVGQALYFDGTSYNLADASDEAKIGLFVVSEVVDADNFKMIQAGKIGGLSSLQPGYYYYVSATTPGTLTTIPPSTGYSNPLLFATSTTEGFVLPFRASDPNLTVDKITEGDSKIEVIDTATTTSITFVLDNAEVAKWDSTAGLQIDTIDSYSGDTVDINAYVEVDKLTVSGAYTLPTADGTAGQYLTTDGAGNASWATIEADRITEDDTKLEVVDDGVNPGSIVATIDAVQTLAMNGSGIELNANYGILFNDGTAISTGANQGAIFTQAGDLYFRKANDGANINLSGTVPTTRGGTGQDSSAWTGFAYVNGGSWSAPYTFIDEDDMVSNSSTAIPSQQSVKSYVDTQIAALSTGISWQNPVKDKDVVTPPASPSTGDRYIVGAYNVDIVSTGGTTIVIASDTGSIASGDTILVKSSSSANGQYTVSAVSTSGVTITINETIASGTDGKVYHSDGAWSPIGPDEIVEWDGTQWLNQTDGAGAPDEGWAVWVEDEDTYYVYNGSLFWTKMGTVVNHSSLLGLTTGDDHTQYMYLNGRSGGQTLIGGTDAGDDLVFQTTSNATKGSYVFSELSDGVAYISGQALVTEAQLSVSRGGTGASSLTDHGVLVGSGVGAITALAVGTSVQVLVGQDGADPVFASLPLKAITTGTSHQVMVMNDAGTQATWDTIDLNGGTF